MTKPLRQLVDTDTILSLLNRMVDATVLVVGDIILDRYVWGTADRLSPEAPVPVVDVLRTEDRLGGAANVVRNVIGLGAKALVCGFVGNDEEGKRVSELLSELGVREGGILIDRSRPTIFKTRVMVGMYQMIRIDREQRGDREVPLRQGFSALVEGHLAQSTAVIISDYGKGAIGTEVLKVCCSDSSRVGLGVRPVMVDPHRINYGNYRGITIAKPNRREAELASGIKISDTKSAFQAARQLRREWQAEMMIITLSEMGMILSGPAESEFHLPTEAREVYDVSGAGDCVTAVFTVALAVGATPFVAGILANVAAGIVVSELGTVPITIKKLRDKVRELLIIHPDRLAIL